jgi:hypothetical protein
VPTRTPEQRARQTERQRQRRAAPSAPSPAPDLLAVVCRQLDVLDRLTSLLTSLTSLVTSRVTSFDVPLTSGATGPGVARVDQIPISSSLSSENSKTSPVIAVASSKIAAVQNGDRAHDVPLTSDVDVFDVSADVLLTSEESGTRLRSAPAVASRRASKGEI